MSNEQYEVYLYIYDLSKGLASSISTLLLGVHIPAIWHTGVVVHGREYFYGHMGIASCDPGCTMLGHPDQIINMGRSEVPYSLFLEYLFSLGESTFAGSKYDLFEYNCNTFSNEVMNFLLGKNIPDEILNLPANILNTPLGQTLKVFLDSLKILPQGQGVNLNPTNLSLTDNSSVNNHNQRSIKPSTESEKTNSIDKNTMAEAKVEDVTTTAEAPAATNTINGDDEVDSMDTKIEARKQRKTYKYDDPPIIYSTVDGVNAINKLTELVNDQLSEEERKQLKDWLEYVSTDNGAWALGTEHTDLLARFLNGGDGKFAPNVPLLTLQLLQAAAFKEDFVLILHQDRKDHHLMSYINKVENLTLAEQEEIIKLMCNLCSQPSSFDWLMYISEWTESDGQQQSNCRVSTRAAVHTLLNDKLTALQRTGVNLIFNFALKELFEDAATELATAVLQFLHSDLAEEQAFLCLTALVRFMLIGLNEIPALAKMLGPDINKFKGKSDRIDQLVEEINGKLAKLPSY